MSQVLPTNEPAPKRKGLFADFSLGQLLATVLAAVAVSIIAAALSVWITQADTLRRLSTIEKAQETTVTREVLDAKWKLVEKIDENVEKLRDLFIEQERARKKR